MKLFVTIVLSLLMTFVLQAKPSNLLIDGLIHVESRGENNAIGDNGDAVGCLQIHKSVIDDVNKVSKVKYSYDDRKNRAKSIEICKVYLNYWGNNYQKETGKVPTQEVYAKIWNGGPNGYQNARTDEYWAKVRAYLKKNKLYIFIA